MSHHELDPQDPRLGDAFAALRAESAEPARPEAVAAARRAMHLAAAEREARGVLPLAAERLRRALTLHRLMAGAAGAAVALGAVSVLGWNAPAGAPLHAVRVAHEQIALALPGIDRASLDLSYAEARLQQAASGQSESDALGEAQSLLDDAHAHLPADHADAAWTRWQGDTRRLAELRDEKGGGDDHGGVPAAGGEPESSPSPRSSDDGGRGETTTTTTTSSASRSGDGGRDGGSTSTATQSGSTTASSTSSGGDGHDGSSSSTSSSTSTSSSGGGSGSDDH